MTDVNFFCGFDGCRECLMCRRNLCDALWPGLREKRQTKPRRDTAARKRWGRIWHSDAALRRRTRFDAAIAAARGDRWYGGERLRYAGDERHGTTDFALVRDHVDGALVSPHHPEARNMDRRAATTAESDTWRGEYRPSKVRWFKRCRAHAERMRTDDEYAERYLGRRAAILEREALRRTGAARVTMRAMAMMERDGFISAEA